MNVQPPRIVRQITRLNNITSGPGSLKLPAGTRMLDFQFFETPDVKLQTKTQRIYQGPKKFWNEVLPRIQFYNPSVAISVREFRARDFERVHRKSFLKLGLKDGTFKQIDIKDKTPQEIIDAMVSELGAKHIPEDEIIQIQLPENSYI